MSLRPYLKEAVVQDAGGQEMIGTISSSKRTHYILARNVLIKISLKFLVVKKMEIDEAEAEEKEEKAASKKFSKHARIPFQHWKI